MKSKAVSGIMLTLLLTGMLKLTFNVPPIVADKGINGLLNECSTFQNSFLYDESKNHSFDWNALEEENSRPPSVDDDKWDFNEMNEWGDFANVDGDSAELVIGVKNGKPNSYADIEGFIGENGGEFVGTISMGGEVRAVVADIPLAGVSSFVTEVRATGLSRYIEPNIKFQAVFVPNDPYWLQQWGPRIIEADYAWNTTLGDHTVLVAVVDTGVDWTHPDLGANYVALGYDWVNNDMDPMDDNGHGTHCAGIIAAGINNNIGIAGLAQVPIMAEKALDDYGTGYSEALANAIIHAVDCGARILSNSWGGYFESELLHEAVLYAYNSGALVVAAAGNDKTASKLYPAAYKEVVAVAATNQSDNPASWTNFGDWIELAAPGVDIYSTISKTHHFEFSYPYDHLSGTSMATPHVAGVAALTWSQFPHMTRDQVWTQLRYAADDLGDQGFDWNYGWGRINARRAVEQAPTEHDLVIWDWDILPALEPWDLLTSNTTVFNFGKMDESNIAVRLLVNGSIVDSTHISFLETNAMTTVSCSWIPTVEGIYNITSYVVPVPGETITIYNARSRNVRVKVGKFFEVPTDYSTIQDAINSASPGYTILVQSGIYYEHVIIQKSLKLIGEDRSTTIIDGSGIGAIVEVAAEDVHVSGFTIRNGGKEGMFDCGILTRQYAGIAIINNTVTNQYEGIVFIGSYGTNKITGNTVVSHNDVGIALIDSNGNYIIDRNTVENATVGIAIGALWGINTISGTISNNTVTSTDCGISLLSSEGTVRGNKVINNYLGIDLARSGGSTLRDNNMTGNIRSLRVSDPLYPSGFFLDIDTSNTVDGKPVYFLVNQRNLVIEPSTFPDIGYLGIVNSTNVIVRGLNMTKNGEGLLLACTTDSTIENVNASENEVGISLSFCSNVTVVGNTLTNNQPSASVPTWGTGGVFLFHSNNSVVSGNTVTNNTHGIWLNKCSENTLSGNNITTNSREGIWLHWSSNNSMSGNNITNSSDDGILLYGSSGNVIFGNNITNNWNGISLDGSSSNTISRNNITHNSRGIFLYGSLRNTLARNNITNNHNGILLHSSSSNTISTNNITNNVYGVYVDIFGLSGPSSNNKFYYNNFINNTYQVIIMNEQTNTWDDGYPSGGNYWSDHNPPDIYCGPYQNVTESDGIGDTPYVIDESNQDNYPLVRPYRGPVRNLNAGQSYPTIQEAINNATEGDIIFALSGKYCEHVVVNKSISLIGENRVDTIIDGNFTGNVMNVTASNVKISNFTMQNSGDWADGIYIKQSEHTIIRNNNILNNDNGIYVWLSWYDSISENNVTNNYYGIVLLDSSENTLRNNHMSGNQRNFFVLGDYPYCYYHDVDSSNTVDGKPMYYWFNQQNRTVPVDAGYVALVYSVNITVQNLDLKNNGQGLLLVETKNSIITGNNLTNNRWGIGLSFSFNNTITGNNIINNVYGVYVDIFGLSGPSSNNKFYYNNFIDNTVQAYVGNSSINVWDNGYPSGGNYWSNYTGTDVYRGPHQNETGSDGIADTQYVINQDNMDHYPLMKPYGGPHDIGIRNVTISRNIFCQGYSPNINITIINYGIYTENFNITAYANTTVIGTLTNVTLTSRNSTTITFAWNTTGVSPGVYVISAKASVVPDEIDKKDNRKEAYSMVTVLSRDVAIKDVAVSKTIVGQGYNVSIIVTVENQGSYTETFNVTAYATTTIIATFTNITLPPGNSTTITFTWNTTDVAKGVYTISANTTLVPSETDTADNIFIFGAIRINMVGDLNSDDKVTITDIVIIALAFGAEPWDSNWNPNADLNDDGRITITDVVIAALHFGETDP